MCGIIGYVGKKHAVDVLIDGLKKLEYRGYDSSGVGVISVDKGQIVLRKMNGKISNLEKLIERKPIAESHIGLHAFYGCLKAKDWRRAGYWFLFVCRTKPSVLLERRWMDLGWASIKRRLKNNH